MHTLLIRHEMTERPPGYIAPNLSPVGLELVPQQLADGVYALMANQPPKDNNGVVVGEHGALVIDSGTTPEVGRLIQRVVADVTDQPIRYLTNTTYHGDHTFGNSAFGPDVAVVSSRINKAAMDDLSREKSMRTDSMYGDDRVLDDVTRWRAPDIVFDRFAEIDLGGRVVQLWHFGPGNGPGDTLVYLPDAKVAWTGNFIGPAGFPGMLLIGDPISYRHTVLAMRATLDIDTFVPGHGFIGPAQPGIDGFLTYLDHLGESVAAAKAAGQSADELYDKVPMRGIDPPPGAPKPYVELMNSLHKLNILLTYHWLEVCQQFS